MTSRQVPCWLIVWLLLGCNSSSSSSPSDDGSGKQAGNALGSCDELLTCVCGDIEPGTGDTANCTNMRTIVEGYRRDYGDEAADSHCAGQLMISGLNDCDGSMAPSPSTPEEGTLLGACSIGDGVCVEHYVNSNVPEGNGPTTCAINVGIWRQAMACPEQDLLGYCEDELAKYGQAFYYYRSSTNDEKKLSDACETGWHANESSAGVGGMSGAVGGTSGGAGKATGGKASATGGSSSSGACDAIDEFKEEVVNAAKDLSGKFNECETVADCEERSNVTVKCPNGLSVWLGIRPIARSSGNDFDAALQAIADEHCAKAPEPATCGGGGIIGAHHLECTEQRCIFVFP